MNDLDRLFVRRPQAVRITPFTPDQADHQMESHDGKPICFIQTREGKRHIDEAMLIAEKSDSYRHPMAPDVFANEYINILSYDSAFVTELKSLVADQLRAALKSDNPGAEIELIADMLAPLKAKTHIQDEYEDR